MVTRRWIVALMVLGLVAAGCGGTDSGEDLSSESIDSDFDSDRDDGQSGAGCYDDPADNPTAVLGPALDFLTDREVQRDLLDCLGRDDLQITSSVQSESDGALSDTEYTIEIRRSALLVEQQGTYRVGDATISFFLNDDTARVTTRDGETSEAPSAGAATLLEADQLSDLAQLEVLTVSSVGLSVAGIMNAIAFDVIGDERTWDVNTDGDLVRYSLSDHPLNLIENSLVEIAELVFTADGTPNGATLRYTAPDAVLSWDMAVS